MVVPTLSVVPAHLVEVFTGFLLICEVAQVNNRRAVVVAVALGATPIRNFVNRLHNFEFLGIGKGGSVQAPHPPFLFLVVFFKIPQEYCVKVAQQVPDSGIFGVFLCELFN